MNKAVRYLLYLLAFVPLMVDNSVYFPYVTGKTMLIRFSVSVAAILFSSCLLLSVKFRKESFAKFKQIIKNPLSIFIMVFFLVFVVSAAFAVDNFRAFYGDVERSEGVLGMMYFYVFLFLTGIVFENDDWIIFFKLTLISGTILFVHELFQFFHGVFRPMSLMGNPIYLATFFLFVIFSALILIDDDRKNGRLWRILSWSIIPLCVIGVFITKSRGVIVGGLVAAVSFMIYFAFRKRDIKSKTNLSIILVCILILVIIFSGLFFVTTTSNFWKKVPGLDRLSQISSGDIGTQIRIISFKIGIESLDPLKNGLKKFLIGWGPENCYIAYNTFYDPHYFEFEQRWYDRTHDKLMDVAVMNGTIGLMLYLGIWASFFGIVLRKNFNRKSAILMSFGVAYFVQNIFVFDSISTYIPFFVLLGYGIYLTSDNRKLVHINSIKVTKGELVFFTTSSVISLFLIFSTIVFFLVPYFQMRAFLDHLKTGDISAVARSTDIFTPYTYAQKNIRTSLLEYVLQNSHRREDSNENEKKLIDFAIRVGEELVKNEPFEPRNDLMMVFTAASLAQSGHNGRYLRLAEEYGRKAYELAPRRQDVRTQLAITLAQEGKFKDAVQMLKDTVALDSEVGDPHYSLAVILSSCSDKYKDVFSEMESALNSKNFTKFSLGGKINPTIIQIYEEILERSLSDHDEKYFVSAAWRLKQLVPYQTSGLDKIIEYARRGMWHDIRLISK